MPHWDTGLSAFLGNYLQIMCYNLLPHEENAQKFLIAIPTELNTTINSQIKNLPLHSDDVKMLEKNSKFQEGNCDMNLKNCLFTKTITQQS